MWSSNQQKAAERDLDDLLGPSGPNEEEDFIPDSLANLVQEMEQTLDATKESLWHEQAAGHGADEEHEKRLQEQILKRYAEQNQSSDAGADDQELVFGSDVESPPPNHVLNNLDSHAAAKEMALSDTPPLVAEPPSTGLFDVGHTDSLAWLEQELGGGGQQTSGVVIIDDIPNGGGEVVPSSSFPEDLVFQSLGKPSRISTGEEVDDDAAYIPSPLRTPRSHPSPHNGEMVQETPGTPVSVKSQVSHVGEVDETNGHATSNGQKTSVTPTRPSNSPRKPMTGHQPPARLTSRNPVVTKAKSSVVKPVASKRTIPFPSIAKAKALPVSSRLLQGTAASQESRRANIERRRELEDHNSRPNTSTYKSKMSAEEGMARARARVRLRKQLEQERNPTKKPVSAAPVRPVRSVRPVTVPTGPRLSTSLRANAHSVRGSTAIEARAKHVVKPVSTPPRKAAIQRTSRPITVPHGPKLATSARSEHRLSTEKAPVIKDHDSTKIAVEPIRHRPRHPTVPHGPKLHLSQRHGDKYVPSPSRKIPTLAQSQDVLAGMLRKDTDPLIAWDGSVTVPEAPKFHSIAKRELPKSTEEREMEVVEYYNAHPFKARPIMMPSPVAAHVTRKPTKLTIPSPFRLRTEERGGPMKAPMSRSFSSDVDEKEVHTQFHARPMPDFSKNPMSTVTRSAKPLTIPEPFNLTASKYNGDARIVKHPSTKTEPKPFKARPLPKTTHRPAPPPKDIPPSSPVKITHVVPPKLSTAARASSRQSYSESSHKKAELLQREKEILMKRRQREKHHAAMLKSIHHSDAPAQRQAEKPFSLRSQARHEAYQKRMQEKLVELEAQRRRLTEFHARGYHQNTPSPVKRVRSNRATTIPEVFHFATDARHRLHEDEVRRAQEARVQKEFKFHARKIPSTTYNFTPISPKEADSLRRVAQVRHRKMEEMKKKLKHMEVEEESTFHARPVPASMYQHVSMSPRAEAAIKRATSMRQKKQELMEKRILAEQESMKANAFKARPVPKTTYQYTPISPNFQSRLQSRAERLSLSGDNLSSQGSPSRIATETSISTPSDITHQGFSGLSETSAFSHVQ